MGDYWSDAENMIQPGKIKVPYTWQAGEMASHYLTRLRDEKKILGKHCPKCDKVLVPAEEELPLLHGPYGRVGGTVRPGNRGHLHRCTQRQRHTADESSLCLRTDQTRWSEYRIPSYARRGGSRGRQRRNARGGGLRRGEKRVSSGHRLLQAHRLEKEWKEWTESQS